MARKPIAQIGEFKEPKWVLVPFTGRNIKGEAASKSAKHSWLRKTYGRPSYCMNTLCDRLSVWYDWAVKTGREYSHNPNDYLWLCRCCHRRYDLTEAKRRQAIKNLWWKKNTTNPGKQFTSDYLPGYKKGERYGKRVNRLQALTHRP